MKRPAVTLSLPLPSPVSMGQRWLITSAKAPWRQPEDLAFVVEEVYTLSERELAAYDVTTAAAIRGELYAVLRDPDADGGDWDGVQLPVSLLLEVGELL